MIALTFKGSFSVSSGCGSRMILPSGVNFTSSVDLALKAEGLRTLGFGTNGEGNEDADVLAGVIRRPKGSFRVVFGNRRIEPGQERPH